MCLFVHTFVYVCIYVFVYLMFTSSNPGSSLSWPSGIDSAAHSPEKKVSPQKKRITWKKWEKRKEGRTSWLGSTGTKCAKFTSHKESFPIRSDCKFWSFPKSDPILNTESRLTVHNVLHKRLSQVSTPVSKGPTNQDLVRSWSKALPIVSS